MHIAQWIAAPARAMLIDEIYQRNYRRMIALSSIKQVKKQPPERTVRAFALS